MTFGSKNPVIQEMVVQIFMKARAHNISMAAVWKRRNEADMILADLGSRGPWYPALGKF